jgi:stalled ribosome alternative rescue factor ArfA
MAVEVQTNSNGNYSMKKEIITVKKPKVRNEWQKDPSTRIHTPKKGKGSYDRQKEKLKERKINKEFD